MIDAATGQLTIAVAAVASAQLEELSNIYYGFQVKIAGVVTEPREGTYSTVTDVVRAT